MQRTPAVPAVSSGTRGAQTSTPAVGAVSSGSGHHLAKVRVAGSSPVVRSKETAGQGPSSEGPDASTGTAALLTRSTTDARSGHRGRADLPVTCAQRSRRRHPAGGLECGGRHAERRTATRLGSAAWRRPSARPLAAVKPSVGPAPAGERRPRSARRANYMGIPRGVFSDPEIAAGLARHKPAAKGARWRPPRCGCLRDRTVLDLRTRPQG